MIPTDLFSILPGTLPGGDNYCFLGWQRYSIDILSRARVIQRDEVGTTFWNISATTPSPDKRIYPWLNLNDGRVYQWSFTFGVWISPRPYSFGQIIPSELGITETQLWALDGGDGTDPRLTLPDGSINPSYVAPTAVTGAMWQVAHSMDGRFPLGAGTIPGAVIYGTTTPITAGLFATQDSNGQAGQYAVPLDVTDMPYHGHGMPTNTTLADPGTVPGAWANVPVFQPGSAWRPPSDSKDRGVAQFVYEGGDPNHNNQPVPHNNMPPYEAVLFIIPTSRIFYVVP